MANSLLRVSSLATESASALTSLVFTAGGRPRGATMAIQVSASTPHTAFGDAGNIRRHARALRGGHGDGLDLARLQLRQGGGQRVHRERDMPAHEVVHRRRASLVGQMAQLDAGGLLDHLAGEMRGRAVAVGPYAYFSGSALAAVTSSLKLLIGTAALASMTIGLLPIRPTGSKLFTGRKAPSDRSPD